MLTLYIPKYLFTDPTHDTTSWYILPTADTSDLSTAIISLEDTSASKEVVLLDITVPDTNTTYYAYAVRNMSDGSVMELPVKPIAFNETTVLIPTVPDLTVETPIVTLVSNTLSAESGTKELVIETTPIRDYANVHGSTFYLIYNSRHELLFKTLTTSNLTSITIPIDDIPEYINGEKLFAKVAHINVFGVSSDFGELIIPGIPNKPELTIRRDHLDPTMNITVGIANLQYEVTEISVSLGKEKIFTKDTAPFTLPVFILSYDKVYRLRVKTLKDGVVMVFEYNLTTLPSREIYDIDQTYTYNNSLTVVDTEYIPKPKKIDGLFNGSFIDVNANSITVYRNGEYNASNSLEIPYTFDPEIDINEEINILSLDLSRFAIEYTSTAGERRLLVLSHNVVIDSFSTVSNINISPLISNSISYAFDTNSIFGIKDVGGIPTLTSFDILLGAETTLVEIPDINTIQKVELIYLSGEKIYIFGDIETAFIYDIKGNTLDKVELIPVEWRSKDWISFLRYDGKPISFSLEGDIAVVYHKEVDDFESIPLLNIPIYKAVRARDGKFKLFTNEAETSVPAIDGTIIYN